MSQVFDIEEARKNWRAENPGRLLPSPTVLRFLVADRFVADGLSINDACRKAGICTASYYEGRKLHKKAKSGRKRAPRANGAALAVQPKNETKPKARKAAVSKGLEEGRVVVFVGAPKDVAEIVATLH